MPRPRAGAALGAKPGDLIAVTGALGATRAKKHLHFEPRLAEAGGSRKGNLPRR